MADEPNLLACSFGTAAYSAPAGAKVRVLTCDVSGGVDLTRSHHALFCNYQGTGSKTANTTQAIFRALAPIWAIPKKPR